MRTYKLACFASVVATIGILAAAPALAAPVPSSTASLSSAISSPVTQARWVGRRWGWRGPGRYWRGRGWYWPGAVAGAIIGGAIVSQAYRYPGPYYGSAGGPGYNDWLAYCSSRYRSFDPASGTFMGYDGHRHPCR